MTNVTQKMYDRDSANTVAVDTAIRHHKILLCTSALQINSQRILYTIVTLNTTHNSNLIETLFHTYCYDKYNNAKPSITKKNVIARGNDTILNASV